VEVSFVGAPPARQIERASGVSEVEVDGLIVRCLVCGSFQPFLEALHGHEVVNLRTSPVAARAPEDASHGRDQGLPLDSVTRDETDRHDPSSTNPR
jgi:hypothetical protein